MRVASSPDELELRGAVIAIGNFDGVHVGHRRLLQHMRELADDAGRPAVVLTFFPPARVVFGNAPLLSTAEEKLELLAAFGPEAVVVIPFDLEYARTDKSVFLAQLARLEPHAVIVGEDFRFGHRREGTLNDLSHVPDRLEVFRLERDAGEPIGSSRIRELLAAGEVEAANRLLGAPYLARGRVVEGDRRGRLIGFPTANLDLPEGKALPLGVFTVEVELGSERHGGMANVGPRPSFPDGAPRLEAHLFDVDADLYGLEIGVRFLRRIRGQRRFGSLEELKAQLARDEATARSHLSEPGAARG